MSLLIGVTIRLLKLSFNFNLTKEMIFDFRVSRRTRQQVATNGDCTEVVHI